MSIAKKKQQEKVIFTTKESRGRNEFAFKIQWHFKEKTIHKCILCDARFDCMALMAVNKQGIF